MSTFGAPGALPSTRPTPPQRGSFPLDHDGECRHVMTNYLKCMKKVKGVNEDECRELAKSYLTCRMDRNLMARDEFKNLGFADASQQEQQAEQQQKQQHPPSQQNTAKGPPEKGVKGELQW